MKQTTVEVTEKRLNFFERSLTLWVAACMLVGVRLGKLLPSLIDSLRRFEFGSGSQINVPIAVLIWLFAWITPAEADQYIAGVIILAAAPCTAVIFVWSYLTDGDPAYTLVQVSVNDLIMLFLFAPVVRFLVSGASSLSVPFLVLLYSVIAFIVIPLTVGTILRTILIRRQGKEWFENVLLPRFAPVTIAALLVTVVFIFTFQTDNITGTVLRKLILWVAATASIAGAVMLTGLAWISYTVFDLALLLLAVLATIQLGRSVFRVSWN
jgi:ACR3 family arsenite transporter